MRTAKAVNNETIVAKAVSINCNTHVRIILIPCPDMNDMRCLFINMLFLRKAANIKAGTAQINRPQSFVHSNVLRMYRSGDLLNCVQTFKTWEHSETGQDNKTIVFDSIHIGCIRVILHLSDFFLRITAAIVIAD